MKINFEFPMDRAKTFLSTVFSYKIEGVSSPAREPVLPTNANGNEITDFTESSESNSDGGETSPKRKDVKKDSKGETSCLTLSVYSAVVIAMIIIFMIIGRDYIKYLLLSLEQTNLWISFVIFTLLFTVVSFPMTWGYILLNVAAGYLYGVFMGVLIIIICALFGITIAHILIKRFLSDFVMNRLANDSMRAVLRVLDGKQGFKIVILSRLTPIPFGLQNALFATSDLPIHHYILASMLGMMPTQGMHAYIGSTLRSMEEVISDSNHNVTAGVIFSLQLLMAAILLVIVIRKARIEFNKAVQEMDPAYKPVSSDEASEHMEKGSLSTNENVNKIPNGNVISPRHSRTLVVSVQPSSEECMR